MGPAPKTVFLKAFLMKAFLVKAAHEVAAKKAIPQINFPEPPLSAVLSGTSTGALSRLSQESGGCACECANEIPGPSCSKSLLQTPVRRLLHGSPLTWKPSTWAAPLLQEETLSQMERGYAVFSIVAMGGTFEGSCRVSKKGEANWPGKIRLLPAENKVARVSEKEYLFGHRLSPPDTDLPAHLTASK